MAPSSLQLTEPQPAVPARPPDIVYEAHPSGLPPLRRYARELLGRRAFIVHLARANLRARNADTVFGQLWALLNPLMLAGTYLFLVAVAFGATDAILPYLGALISALFAFFFTRNGILLSGKSVTGSGGLILNSSFPRLLLPLSATVSAFLLYVPMLAVYSVFHLAAGFPLAPSLVLLPALFVLQAAFGTGLGMLVAVATVYFRDTSKFLPYAVRIWLYMSPIIWTADQLPPWASDWLAINPMYSYLTGWTDVVVDGIWPPAWILGLCVLWAVVTLPAGVYLFMSREHDFAIRL